MQRYLRALIMNGLHCLTLHAMAGQCKRWKLHQAVSMMPDDADGVWSGSVRRLLRQYPR